MHKITTYVFDAYGTLFDVNAACRKLSKEVGNKWNELSSLWRLRQVEYTWLRNSMKEYIDFWKITSDALDYAMETLNIKNNKLRNDLLSLYLKLEAYPEVKPVLENIKNMGLKTAILSNGNNFPSIIFFNISTVELEFKNLNLSIQRNKINELKNQFQRLIKKETYWRQKEITLNKIR